MYYINEGIKSIRRHLGVFCGSVCIIAVCLALLGSAVLVIFNLGQNLNDLIEENEFVAYAVKDWDTEENEALEMRMDALENVEKAEYISPEEAMESFRTRMSGENLYQSLPENLLPARFLVSVEDIDLLQETADEITAMEEIDHCTLALSLARALSTTKKTCTALAIFLLAALLMISVFIISNSVRLAMKGREEEIAVMKIVGATNHFIRGPYVVEGMLLGAVSGVLGFSMIFVFYAIIRKIFFIYQFNELFHMAAFKDVWMQMLPSCLVFSILLGGVGTLVALRKLLDV